MAHFARVQHGKVEQVIAVSNVDAPDEITGQAFIAALGFGGEWLQTSYNGNPIDGKDRGPFAGIGFSWDGERFIPSTAPIAEAI